MEVILRETGEKIPVIPTSHEGRVKYKCLKTGEIHGIDDFLTQEEFRGKGRSVNRVQVEVKPSVSLSSSQENQEDVSPQ